MGTIERKERERRWRKELILNAAISIIEEKGFEKTTMDEIAEKTELSKGTLYLYFNDKASLFQAIKKRALQNLHDLFLTILQKDKSGAELVREMMFTFIELTKDNAAFARAMMLYEQTKNNFDDENKDYPIQRECIKLKNEMLILIIRALQTGIQDGSIKNTLDPHLIALQITFHMAGIIQFWLTGPSQKGLKIMDEKNMGLPDLMKLFLDTQFNTIKA